MWGTHGKGLRAMLVRMPEAECGQRRLRHAGNRKTRSVVCRYTDPSKPLCRVLRQLGNGNVVEGMYAAKEDSVFDKDIVHALTPSTVSGVDVAAVRASSIAFE